ncbi:hypothetical protein EN35_25825 [Rhodococcus qingshengii]|nr:hypothetical protein EN35_25825 [Rhodococcus qingshengii]
MKSSEGTSRGSDVFLRKTFQLVSIDETGLADVEGLEILVGEAVIVPPPAVLASCSVRCTLEPGGTSSRKPLVSAPISVSSLVEMAVSASRSFI